MKELRFKDAKLDFMEDTFGLKQVFKMPELENILHFPYTNSELEIQIMERLNSFFVISGDDWNEEELKNKFISPLIMLSLSPGESFSYFMERELSVTVEEYELKGKIDAMLASGIRNPKKPFFCLNEYKRATDPDGDPRGQVLDEMLAAQTLNNNNRYVYGCYVIGRFWFFLILKEKEYIISKDFSITDEITDILRIFKGINVQIEKFIAEEEALKIRVCEI
ncbi:MAG: hypothetical protein QM536_00955 [Chitinophagaceae bacterium]|nr:hypothetical protein [Chitinophagaceae bacterium]